MEAQQKAPDLKQTDFLHNPRWWKDLAWLHLGVVLTAVGIYFFKFPNHFSTGGVSGISVVLSGIWPSFSPGSMVFIINMALLLVGFLFLGRGFGLRTAYASILMSSLTWLLEKIYPMDKPFTTQPLLELVFAVALTAFGSAILFNIGASTGGTDIVAMLMKKYTHIDIGKALILSDSIITVSSCAVFGMETGLFSILGLIAKSTVVDTVVENLNLSKYFTIVTTKPDEVSSYIVHKLERGATMYEAMGAFSHDKRTVILTAVKRPQAVLLRNYARKVDPMAFILISNTSEIIGKGFRGQI